MRTLCFALSLVFGSVFPSAGAEVLVVKVEDALLKNGAKLRFIEKVLTRAQEEKLPAVIFQIEAKQGSYDEVSRVLSTVAESEVTTVAWIPSEAVGPGALFALGCDQIYLGPLGVIGGEQLVKVAEEAEDQVLAETGVSDVTLAKVRAIAGYKERDPKLAQAFLDPKMEFALPSGEVLSAKGSLLALSAAEATMEVEGAPLLANGVAKSLEGLLQEAGLPSDFVMVDREGWKDFLAARDRSGTEEKRRKMVAVETEEEEVAQAREQGESKPTKKIFGRSEEESYVGKVVVIPVGENDLVNGPRFEFMRRTLQRAEEEKAAMVVFELNTPGGDAWQTAGIMMEEMLDMSMPLIGYVNTRAISAGALIACACDRIYMAPAGSIGAAGIVSSAGEIEGMMKKKVEAAFLPMMESVALEKGGERRAAIVRAMMIPSATFEWNGEVLDDEETLLGLSPQQAVEENASGEPLLAAGIVADLEELLALEGMEAETVEAKPLGFELFAQIVANYAAILILVGIAAAWTEAQAPGFGVAGAISLLAFGTLFFATGVAGKLGGWELAFVFGVGVVLLIVEFFLLPGFLIPGIVGMLCVIGSLLTAMVDRVDLEKLPGQEELGVGQIFEALRGPMVQLSLGLLGGLILILVLMRYLPKTRVFGSWMTLESAVAGGGSAAAVLETQPEESPKGKVAVAQTDLRPAGKIAWNNEILDATTKGRLAAKGAEVRILRREAGVWVVEELDE
ncbi:MAG: S49 family peptidase [Verrucomicrobiota bacterium]